MGVTEQLARMVVETRLEELPQGVITHAKERMLDTFAVMVGGAFEECARIAERFVEDTGGAPVSQLVARPGRTSPPNAAMLNGIAAHALDYDETSMVASHITPCTFPAILAVADIAGASGKDVLLAYILAFEVHARIGWGTMPHKDLHLNGWHPVPTLGSFGATAGAARILGLDLDATRRALGIAGSETGGIRKNIGTMTKPFHAGNAAKNGVVAAMLAQRGYTANLDVLEGVSEGFGHDRYGFCETFSHPGNYNLADIVKDIGTRWELDLPRSVVTKRHPGSTPKAAPMDMTIELVTENDITPEQIEGIDVATTTNAVATAHYWAHNGLDARYSMIYEIAVAALDRKGTLLQYTDERVQRPDVQAFMHQVKIFADPEMDRMVNHPKRIPVNQRGLARVTIHLKDGRGFSRQRNHTRGYPQDPLLWDDIVEKYLDCAEYAGLPKKGIDPRPLIEMVQNIEGLADGTRLLGSLAPAR